MIGSLERTSGEAITLRNMNMSVVVPSFGISAALVLVIMLSACTESRGAQLFKSENCIACHAIGGTGGGVAPDLSAVGRRRSRDYIVEQIRDPQSHNPNTVMPSFGHLPQQDIEALADYLSGMK